MVTAEQSAYTTPQYFKTTEQGNVIPLDPITGEALRPGTIPESLLADEELRKGFDFLRNNAERIRVGLLLSRHETREDLATAGINLRDEAEDLASKGGVLFLEGITTTDQSIQRQRLLAHISNLNGEQAEDMRLKLRSTTGLDVFSLDEFRKESFSQITGTQVEVTQPDYLKDSERPADRALSEWKKTLDEVLSSPEPSLQDMDKWYSLNVGFTAYRDWYLVGKIGSYLADREAKQATPPSDDIAAKLVVGTTHTTIGQHFEGFGASVDYVGETEDKRSPQVARLVRAVGDVVLTQQARVDQTADLILAHN